MRRSPTNSSACSSSSASSSSSSCIATSSDNNNNNNNADLPKSKRQKKNHQHHHHNNPGQEIKACEINAAASNNAHNQRRSSIYRGVTRHRWTGRFEAHLWDKSCWNNIQNKKGRQVYLGAYDNEDAAARTYDLAALKYWGTITTLNFPVEKYEKELEEMQRFSKEEYLASLRRQSSGFSRGVSKYRGVARHHHNGRWEARIGRLVGNKYLYLGTYNTQEEAAAAYDMAAIEYRGANAVTNFDISNYIDRLKNTIILPNSDQPQEETNNSASEQEVEQEVVQQQQQQHDAEQEEEDKELEVNHQHHDQPDQYPNLLDPQIENPTLVQDVNVRTHELTWSFMDTGLITALPLEELPVGELHGGHDDHLPDLFGDIGFEDNIDLIFEAVDHDQGHGKSCGDHDDHVVVGRMLSTSSPSSSSTTTSVSSNFCI